MRPAPRAIRFRPATTAPRPLRAASGSERTPTATSAPPRPIRRMNLYVRAPGARTRRRFEYEGGIGPGERASVAAAAFEEVEIASARKGEGVGKRLVQIVLDHAALGQHAAGPVDHVDAPAGV